MTENELKLNKTTKKAGSKKVVSSLPVHLKKHVDTRDTEMDERDKHKAKTSPEETKSYNDQIPKINNESAKIGERLLMQRLKYSTLVILAFTQRT